MSTARPEQALHPTLLGAAFALRALATGLDATEFEPGVGFTCPEPRPPWVYDPSTVGMAYLDEAGEWRVLVVHGQRLPGGRRRYTLEPRPPTRVRPIV